MLNLFSKIDCRFETSILIEMSKTTFGLYMLNPTHPNTKSRIKQNFLVLGQITKFVTPLQNITIFLIKFICSFNILILKIIIQGE